MTGTSTHTIDDKGRLIIPTRFRDELGETFYVAIGMGHCLSLYPEKSWEALTARLESLPYSKTQKTMRLLYANTVKCTPDPQWRILLPAKLRKYAGLNKNIVAIGVSSRAELWDEDAWNAMENEALTEEAITGAMEELGL